MMIEEVVCSMNRSYKHDSFGFLHILYNDKEEIVVAIFTPLGVRRRSADDIQSFVQEVKSLIQECYYDVVRDIESIAVYDIGKLEFFTLGVSIDDVFYLTRDDIFIENTEKGVLDVPLFKKHLQNIRKLQFK